MRADTGSRSHSSSWMWTALKRSMTSLAILPATTPSRTSPKDFRAGGGAEIFWRALAARSLRSFFPPPAPALHELSPRTAGELSSARLGRATTALGS